MKVNFSSEKKLWVAGYKTIVGVDEVGRGAWAGPIVAAAVVVNIKKISGQPWLGQVKDSKKLSPLARAKIYHSACAQVAWAIGVVSNQEIDKLGIGAANVKAVTLAVKNLKPRGQYVLADYIVGWKGRIAGLPTKTIIKGDGKIFSIALASIIAKVTRDRIMMHLDKKYPSYFFNKNKGYGTLEHSTSLKKRGPCRAHRLTYRPLATGLL